MYASIHLIHACAAGGAQGDADNASAAPGRPKSEDDGGNGKAKPKAKSKSKTKATGPNKSGPKRPHDGDAKSGNGAKVAKR